MLSVSAGRLPACRYAIVDVRHAGSVSAESGWEPNLRYDRISFIIGIFIGGTPDNWWAD